MRNEAERAVMTLTLNDIQREATNRYSKKQAAEQRKEERARRKELNALTAVVPFQIGNKWGLRNNGRMVVPPMYRTIHTPVGKYCAVESYPGMWGVIAVDGKVAIEPGYEGVVIRPDGRVELTVRPGKVISLKLNK